MAPAILVIAPLVCRATKLWACSISRFCPGIIGPGMNRPKKSGEEKKIKSNCFLITLQCQTSVAPLSLAPSAREIALNFYGTNQIIKHSGINFTARPWYFLNTNPQMTERLTQFLWWTPALRKRSGGQTNSRFVFKITNAITWPKSDEIVYTEAILTHCSISTL